MSDPRPGQSDDAALPQWALSVPPEARAIQGHRAGFVTRSLAVGVDFAVVAILVGLIYLGWAALLFILNPTTPQLPQVSAGGVILTGGVLSWLLFTTAWSTTGRSFGARVMGIRVVNYEGQVMPLPGAALRAAFCLVFMPGIFWVIVSPENRSLQDTVIRTSVIHDWTKRPPEREKKGEH
jgi:uncharacterized RDD family membrane protein YckC